MYISWDCNDQYITIDMLTQTWFQALLELNSKVIQT